MTHLRFEVLRMLRNPLFYGLTVGLPLVLFYAIASEERHKTFDGTSFPLYFMTAMAAYGVMWATVGSGARISRDRATGWLRQVRITPLRARTDFTAKVVSAYLLALPTLVLLLLAGASLGVRLGATQWLELAGLQLAGLAPFIVIGVHAGLLVARRRHRGLLRRRAPVRAAGRRVRNPARHLRPTVRRHQRPALVLAGASRESALGRGAWPAEAWIVIAVWTVALIPVAALAYRRSAIRA